MTLKALALAILSLPEMQQESTAMAARTYDYSTTVPWTEHMILGVMTQPTTGLPIVVLNQ